MAGHLPQEPALSPRSEVRATAGIARNDAEQLPRKREEHQQSWPVAPVAGIGLRQSVANATDFPQ